MVKVVDWSKYFKYYDNIEDLQEKFGIKKLLGMGLMPVRGPFGFRKLDYEFAEKDLNVKEIMDTLEKYHINLIGITIKDTDGACLWDTKVGWNPTNRDILGEFCDDSKDRNIKIAVSFTSMNDAYQGNIHPDRVSVLGKSTTKKGVTYKKGTISTHFDGELRVDLPEGISFEEYKKKVPFLTKRKDEHVGKKKGSRGKGYIPMTSFMCPNSKHVDYLIELAKEVTKNYKLNNFTADYIRYDGSFKHLCTCHRCAKLFREKYGEKPKILRSRQWFEFKEDSIVRYAQKLHNTIKSIDNNCVTAWACLPDPIPKRLCQNWTKLSTIFDVVAPMEYPYLMGTYDDGIFWGKLADIVYWYSVRYMKKRAHKFNSPAIGVTNSVECNAREMLKQVRGFDFGLGVFVFKYYGTKKSQWEAINKYAKEEIGLENLGLK